MDDHARLGVGAILLFASREMRKAMSGKVLLAFITVSIAWGTTYGAIRVAVESFPPFFLAAVRFVFAGAVLLVGLRIYGLQWPSWRDWGRIAVGGFLLLSVANAFLAWGEQYLPSVVSALLINVGPLMYVSLAWMLGERVAPRAWVGLAVGFMGVVVMIAPRLRDLLRGEVAGEARFWPAVGITLLGPCVWSCGSVYVARRRTGCNPLMTAAGQNVMGGLGAGVIALALRDFQHLPPVSMRSWLALAWLVVVGSWLGYMAYIYCVLKLPSARVAVTVYLNTVTALLIGTLLLGEKLTPAMLMGGIVLLIGVALVQSARLPRRALAKKNPHEES